MSEHRTEFINGLRALADWLTVNPQAAAPSEQRMLIPLHTNAAVEEFAAGLGVDVEYDDEGNASANITFGPIAYYAYGYVDFKEHCARNDEQRARRWANQHGMVIQPDQGGGDDA